MRLPTPPRSPWHNAFPLAPDDVERIVAADLPELANCRAKRLGEGWDFTTFVVNSHVVFRFPKRRQCVRQQKREIDALKRLRPRIVAAGVDVPDYRFVIERSKVFPLAYAGYPLLPGRPLVEVPADACDAIALATAVGRLIGVTRANAIGKAPRPAADELPLVDILRELDEATAALPDSIAVACRAMLKRYAPARSVARVFSHGDLGVEHILIDERGRPVSVIDWGDVGFAHPTHDFVGLWAWGGDEVAARAIAGADAKLSPQDWRRLRSAGISYAIGTVYYGYKDGHEALRRSGLEWLARAFAHGQIEDPSRTDG